MQTDTHWEFETANFRVAFESVPEYDLDMSWDDDGTVSEQLVNGEMVAFCARVAVYYHGSCIGEDYLGQCIYADPEEFRDHVGRKKGNAPYCGSYFSDMVAIAIANAREYLKTTQAIAVRA